MTFQEIVDHAKHLLRQDMKQTLVFIVPKVNPRSDIFNDLIQVEGRYHHIENEFNKGLIDSQEKEQGFNQVRVSLLSLVDRLTAADVMIQEVGGGAAPVQTDNAMLEKLRASMEEIERLKAENTLLKSQEQKHKLKIIVQCDPEIDDQPSNYSCQCIILDDDTGETIEKEIPLRREPGGIVATIHDIKPSAYVQIRVKDQEKEWESDYFSPQFLTQMLRLV